MSTNARIDENCDFQQVALPLDLAIGEHILQRIRLEGDSESGTWHELYLVGTPHGFLIEKHSGSSVGGGRSKETWFHRTLADAKRTYSQIYSYKLSHKRQSPGKRKVAKDENEGQQKFFN